MFQIISTRASNAVRHIHVTPVKQKYSASMEQNVSLSPLTSHIVHYSLASIKCHAESEGERGEGEWCEILMSLKLPPLSWAGLMYFPMNCNISIAACLESSSKHCVVWVRCTVSWFSRVVDKGKMLFKWELVVQHWSTDLTMQHPRYVVSAAPSQTSCTANFTTHCFSHTFHLS